MTRAGESGAAADRHAVIVIGDGAYRASGQRLTHGAVDSPAKLGALLTWLAVRTKDRQAQVGLAPHGLTGQLYVVGEAAVRALGWYVDPGDERADESLKELRARTREALAKAVTTTLPDLSSAGWELRGRDVHGHHVQLVHKPAENTSDRDRLKVDVIIEPYAWTMDVRGREGEEQLGVLGSGDPDDDKGTALPGDDHAAAVELGRRLAWCIQHFDTLPGSTGASTGAAVLDRFRRAGIKRNEKLKPDAKNRSVVVNSAGPVPPLNDPPVGDLEPPIHWARVNVRRDDIDAACDWDGDETVRLVSVDQRASYLASAGMVQLGWGEPENVDGREAERRFQSAGKEALPFGVIRVSLPALASLASPWDLLPAPHQLWTPTDRPVTLWVTTETLNGICAPLIDGGTGMDLADISFEEAWLFPQQGFVLKRWQSQVASAYKLANESGDRAMKELAGAAFRGYIGRMANADMWKSEYMVHHHQPLWRASIMAHARFRSRRKAAVIAAQHGLYPLRSVTDSLVYAVPKDVDIADHSTALGQLRVEKSAVLDTDGWLALLAADGSEQVARVVDEALARGER